MSTLISFLGKGSDKGYRSTNYKFEDNQIFEGQKYIGLTLAQKIKPNKLILLGTAGSMWDIFLEASGDHLAEEWCQLSDAVRSHTVTQEQLQPFESYLQQTLQINHVQCILIPFARTTEEQIEILSLMANALNSNESVILDVTHGFRHLPMLALVAARFLKTLKNVNVQHIYYGALEMTVDQETPVLKLNSLLQMLDWVEALGTFDKDGDYGIFAKLLEQEGLPEIDAKLLKQAAFYERTTNSSKSREKLNTFIKRVDEFNQPIFSLFKDQLLSRFEWIKKANRGLQEQELAKEYLSRRDYVRSVIFAIEGKISSSLFNEKKDENNFLFRDETSKNLSDSESFRKLKMLRNTLAHGNRSNDKSTLAVLKDESTLQQSLKDRLKKLLE